MISTKFSIVFYYFVFAFCFFRLFTFHSFLAHIDQTSVICFLFTAFLRVFVCSRQFECTEQTKRLDEWKISSNRTTFCFQTSFNFVAVAKMFRALCAKHVLILIRNRNDNNKNKFHERVNNLIKRWASKFCRATLTIRYRNAS